MKYNHLWAWDEAKLAWRRVLAEGLEHLLWSTAATLRKRGYVVVVSDERPKNPPSVEQMNETRVAGKEPFRMPGLCKACYRFIQTVVGEDAYCESCKPTWAEGQTN